MEQSRSSSRNKTPLRAALEQAAPAPRTSPSSAVDRAGDMVGGGPIDTLARRLHYTPHHSCHNVGSSKKITSLQASPGKPGSHKHGRNCQMRTAIILTATLVSCGLCSSAGAQQADMTFFITSVGSGKGGDLRGLAGADAHCQALAQTAGAGNKTWRAYLSTNGRGGANAVNARDRIGNGPWQNAKGAVVAASVADLHGDNTKMGKANALDEMGRPIKVRGDSPVMHDILTGSDKDGRAFPPNMDLTCSNWTSSSFGVAMLGHADREGNPPVAGSQNLAAYAETAHSWNAAHTSRGCSQPDLIATGGNGLFYCFAVR
jgi:hypothetical protein